MTRPLSPAAQAVLAAPTRAAALRALADQVVDGEVGWVGRHPEAVETYLEIRAEILAIAAELEGSNG